MFHRTDFGGFLVCCYKAIQQLNGVEKNSVAISLMLNHNLTGLYGVHIAWTPGFEPRPHWWEASALTTASPLLLQYTPELKRHILAA